jgi:hypothetical protein
MVRLFLAITMFALPGQPPDVHEKASQGKASQQFKDLVEKVALIGAKINLPDTFIDHFRLQGTANDPWYQVIVPLNGRTRRTICVPEHHDAKHCDIVLTRKLEQGTCFLKVSKDGKLDQSALADAEGISELSDSERLFATERQFWLAWVEKPSFLCQVKKVDADKHLIVVAVGGEKVAEKRMLTLKLKNDVRVTDFADGLKGKRLAGEALSSSFFQYSYT